MPCRPRWLTSKVHWTPRPRNERADQGTAAGPGGWSGRAGRRAQGSRSWLAAAHLSRSRASSPAAGAVDPAHGAERRALGPRPRPAGRRATAELTCFWVILDLLMGS